MLTSMSFTPEVLFTQGYVVYSQRQKLKPEHRGKSPHEIKALRLSGAQITETVEVKYDELILLYCFGIDECVQMLVELWELTSGASSP